MTTRTAYPNTVTQSGDSTFASFDGLQNVKSNTSTYAVTKLIKAKTGSPNRPKVIVATDFKLNIPTGSKINSIKAIYVQDTEPYDGKHVSIAAPTLTLKNIAGNSYQKKGVAPNANLTTRSVTFYPNNDTDFNISNVNSSEFGVYLNYPKNTSKNSGYLRVKYIQIVVDYTEPEYTVSWEAPSSVEQGTTFDTSLVVSNKNLVNYKPTLNVLTPAGFSLKNAPSGDGTWTKIDNRQYTWQPNFNTSKGTISLGLSFTVNVTGTLPVNAVFEADETLTGVIGTRTISVIERATPEQDEETTTHDSTIIDNIDDKNDMGSRVRQLVSRVAIIGIDPGEYTGSTFQVIELETDTTGLEVMDKTSVGYYLNPDHSDEDYSNSDVLTSLTASTTYDLTDTHQYIGSDGNIYIGVGTTTPYIGELTIRIPHPVNTGYVYENTFIVDTRPQSLTEPYATLLTLSDEELDRLGDGTVYTLSTEYWSVLPASSGGEIYSHSTEETTTRNGTHKKSITTLTNLGDNWEVSFDFKTTGYGGFYIVASDYASEDVPSYCVYIESDVRNAPPFISYGYTTTTWANIDLFDSAASSYTSMKISKNGDTVTYTIGDDSYSISDLTWFNYDSLTLVLMTWPLYTSNDTTYVKNIVVTKPVITNYLHDWGKNYRLGVFNNQISTNLTNYTYIDDHDETHDATYDSTNYDNLTSSDIIGNAEYWSPILTGHGKHETLECPFVYNKDYPFYIIVTGDYSEYTNPSQVRFISPSVIESEAYHGNETTGNYPVPIGNLLTTDDSTITIPEYEKSTPVIVYDLDLQEHYGTNTMMAIRGIEVQCTVEDYDNCVLTAQLKSPTGATGERSLNLDDNMLDTNNTLVIGGVGDLWNFNTLDLVDLADWEVQLMFSNILTETSTTINYHNVKIVFYVEEVQTQRDYCYINGEDIRYYGAFVQDIDIPSGLDTSTSYLNVNGTDTNDAYRQNIREKTITLELEIGDNCDLEMATNSLRQLTQLILNDRDKYNRPIPKQISFSFMPDVYFEYIVEDTFDNPIEISSYNIKCKLVVPSGTSYKVNPTTTNTVGYVQGLAKVNPTISIKPTGNNMEITETRTGQKFTITYTGDNNITDGILVINTHQRQVYHQTDEDSNDKTNYTKYVDFNSDWFNIHGAYEFNSTNCYIRAVEYTERW